MNMSQANILKSVTFNSQVQDVFDSPLSQTHAFVEKAYKIDKPSNFVNLNQDYNRHKILNYYYEYLKPQTLFSIDINKCRHLGVRPKKIS